MNTELIDIAEHSAEGIKKAVESGAWMIQLLNYMPSLAPERILKMQKHLESDESFSLLSGKAIIITADGDAVPGEISAVELQANRVYTVRKGVWHAVSLSKDAKVLIVENSNTVPENSPKCELTDRQKAFIRELSWDKP